MHPRARCGNEPGHARISLRLPALDGLPPKNMVIGRELVRELRWMLPGPEGSTDNC